MNLTAAVLLTAILTTGSLAYAKTNPTDPNMKGRNAVENLKNGIKSENEGLKKSAIYYAGYYRVSETVPVLTETVKNETEPSTKILIALVLYRIGDEKGINLVKNMADSDKNTEVRRMCTCIYNAYKSGNTDELSLTGIDK
jgi:HEAT repeat protein